MSARFNLNDLVRKNILALKPYSSARNEYAGKQASVFIDANENPFNSGFNRYPDPLQEEVKAMLAPIKSVCPDQIFLGNGSDEAIDLVYRVFCEPRLDNVIAIDPTYGMYEVCADINDVEYRKVQLDEHFQVRASSLLNECDCHTKVIFLCSPNNPSGNDLNREEMEKVILGFRGIVVVDEAYSDFSSARPFRLDLDKYPNVIVLNTFSKAWGSAAIRLGMAFASKEIISLFNKVKYPYNVNVLTQNQAKEVIANADRMHKQLMMVLDERASLMKAFGQLPICQKVYPSDANFFLARVSDANKVYNYLVDKGIIVRNRTHITLCNNCLRVTIGTVQDNTELLCALRQYKQ